MTHSSDRRDFSSGTSLGYLSGDSRLSLRTSGDDRVETDECRRVVVEGLCTYSLLKSGTGNSTRSTTVPTSLLDDGLRLV